MITLKEFIAEGFLSDLGTTIGLMKKEIAEDLGHRTYKIIINRGVTPENGIRINIAVPIPEDHMDAQDFFEKMAVRTVKKSFSKHFEKYRFESSDGTTWDNGRAVWIAMTVPDADGMM